MVTTKISYLHGPRSGINMASQLNTRGGELSFGGVTDATLALGTTPDANVAPGPEVQETFPTTPTTGLDLNNNNYVKYGAIALLAYFMFK